MFTINIGFLGLQPPKARYSSMSLKDIYNYLSYEAELTVTYSNKIFFSEEVSVVEFYWYLDNWYRRFLAGNTEQFIYSTVENNEPILVFSPQKSNYWKIDSVWKHCDEPALIKEEILAFEVHKLLNEIKLSIEA